MGLANAGCTDDTVAPIACFTDMPWAADGDGRLREILTRLAGSGRRVCYIECIPQDAVGSSVSEEPCGVVRLRLRYRYDKAGWNGTQKWLGAQKIAGFFRRYEVHRPILWFTHPSLFALGYSHEDSGIVYDVVESLAESDPENSDVYFDELMMLAEADIVFANGDGVYEHLGRMVAVLQSDLYESGRKRARSALPEVVRLETFSERDSGNWDEVSGKIAVHLRDVTALRSGCGSR